MKRLGLLLSLALALALPATAAITLVQHTANTADGFSGGSVTLTFGAAITAGHQITVCMGNTDGGNPTFGFSDTAGDTATEVSATTPGGFTTDCWFVQSAVGGNTTVSISASSSNHYVAWAEEWSGAGGIDVSATGSDAFQAWTPASATTTASSDLLIEFVDNVNGSTNPAGTGWTMLEVSGSGVMAYQVAGAPGAYSANLTPAPSGNDHRPQVLMAIKPSVPAPSGTVMSGVTIGPGVVVH